MEALGEIDLGGGRTVIDVSLGWTHACAVLDDCSLKCWGYNGYGALGQNDKEHRGDGPDEMGDNLPAVYVGEGRTVSRLALGYGNTCVVLDNGDAKCW